MYLCCVCFYCRQVVWITCQKYPSTDRCTHLTQTHMVKGYSFPWHWLVPDMPTALRASYIMMGFRLAGTLRQIKLSLEPLLFTQNPGLGTTQSVQHHYLSITRLEWVPPMLLQWAYVSENNKRKRITPNFNPVLLSSDSVIAGKIRPSLWGVTL